MAKMTNAGKYNRQMTWKVRSYTTDSASGAKIPSWTGSTVLWGSLIEGSGSYADQFGAPRNRTEATITLRQFPAVSAQDRLIDILFSHTYIIDTVAIMWETNETVVTAYRLQNDPV